MLRSVTRLWQSCGRFSRAFGGCFPQILEHQTMRADYATLCGHSGIGVARGLAAETIVAFCKATRLALRRESRRRVALRRLDATRHASAQLAAADCRVRTESNERAVPQPER